MPGMCGPLTNEKVRKGGGWPAAVPPPLHVFYGAAASLARNSPARQKTVRCHHADAAHQKKTAQEQCCVLVSSRVGELLVFHPRFQFHRRAQKVHPAIPGLVSVAAEIGWDQDDLVFWLV